MDIEIFIEGVPYSKDKPRGDKQAAGEWTRVIYQATKNLPKVKRCVYMNVEFILPTNKYPADHPYGPDLDNLLKRLFDALGDTIFSDVQGKDGAVVQLRATKHEAAEGEKTGVVVIIGEL